MLITEIFFKEENKMMGFRTKTKKAANELIGQNVSDRFIETSIFGREYSPTGEFTVVFGGNPSMIRKSFGILTVENNILKKVR